MVETCCRCREVTLSNVSNVFFLAGPLVRCCCHRCRFGMVFARDVEQCSVVVVLVWLILPEQEWFPATRAGEEGRSVSWLCHNFVPTIDVVPGKSLGLLYIETGGCISHLHPPTRHANMLPSSDIFLSGRCLHCPTHVGSPSYDFCFCGNGVGRLRICIPSCPFPPPLCSMTGLAS